MRMMFAIAAIIIVTLGLMRFGVVPYPYRCDSPKTGPNSREIRHCYIFIEPTFWLNNWPVEWR